MKAPTLKRFWNLQAEWSRKIFGSDEERGPEGPLKHLAKEVQEVLDNKTDLEEYVDCQFLIFDAARRAGFTFEEFVLGCFAKLEKNKKRAWPKPTSDQPVEHVREI